MSGWVNQGYEEYARRLPGTLQPRLLELPLAKRSKSNSTAKAKEIEGKQICAAVADSSVMIALDVKGKALSTEQLADKLKDWQMQGNDIAIVIGGPDGIASSCLAQAQEIWSLSALTLPHPLVRVVLIEQLYRAWSINQHHPYHK